MGIDIYIIREARIDGKWQSCEPTMKEYRNSSDYNEMYDTKDRRDESSCDLDIGRCSQLFGIIAGEAFCTCDCMMDYPNGLPDDLSENAKCRIEDENKHHEEWLISLHLAPIYDNKRQYYNCTFKDMKDYLAKWRNDMIETGSIPYDFINDEGNEKLERFNNGIYKKDLEKKMAFMLKVYDDAECNPLVWFLNELNTAKCGENFTAKLSDIPDEDKRIVFWFT